MEAQESATSSAEAGTTSIEAPSHPLSTAGTVAIDSGESATHEGRPSKEAPKSGESEELNFESIPENLRPHVEKFAKKYEADFKKTYTKKFMDLSSKETQWTTERQKFESQIEQFKKVAEDVLANPSKLEHYRQVLGIKAPTQEIPPEITTVGDLLDWNKRQMESYKETLKEELRREAQTTVQQTTAVQRWETALASKRQDKHFSKYEKFIIDIAQQDPEIKSQYNGSNEVEALNAAQDKLREMMREDMEEVRASTLADQKKKVKVSTQVPIKTTQPLPRAAQTREEVIARVREKYGPPI